MPTFTTVLPILGPNAPGVQANIYWADVSVIATIAPINAATLEVTAISMVAPTDKFKLLAIVREDSMIKDDMNGATDSIHYVEELTVRVKGMEPEIMAALNAGAGQRCVVLVQQPSGVVNIMGNKTNYAEITAMSSDSGKAGSSDRKGTVLTIKSIGHMHKLPFLTAGVLDTLI